jgi:integrase
MTESYRTRNPTGNITPISSHKKFKSIRSIQQTHLTLHDADPVKDKAILDQIKSHLLSTGRYGHRNWLIFVVGINNARRCGDILHLTIGDVFSQDTNEVVKSVTKREQKTSKILTYYLPDLVRSAIKDYINSIGFYSLDDPLFRSQKGGFMKTSTYWAILKKIRDELDLKFQLSTHSMRKSFGYHKYMALEGKQLPNGYDVVDVLQEAYGHSSRKITLKYLGITEEVQMDLYNTDVL